MFLSYIDGKWVPAPNGIRYTFIGSVNIEDIPAPPPVDARMVSLDYKNNVFTAKFLQQQREDDRMPYDVPVFYQWRFGKWSKVQ
jgi:hypothetical protein